MRLASYPILNGFDVSVPLIWPLIQIFFNQLVNLALGQDFTHIICLWTHVEQSDQTPTVKESRVTCLLKLNACGYMVIKGR